MELHAESVLEVAEKEEQGELQFRQVRGDVDELRGKWMLEAAPRGPGGGEATLLRYAVEVKVAAPSPALHFLEPLLEAVVAEDVPRGLAGVAAAAEAMAAAAAAAAAAAGGPPLPTPPPPARPRLADLADDFGLLAAELEAEFGTGGATRDFPTRAALRAAGRSDLEKAIAAHGGPAAVAARLGWPLPYRERKPRGYWADDAAVEAELAAFIAEAGLPPATMPSKTDMVRAGRHDLARVAERRGGLFAVAAAVGYRMPTRAGASAWAEHVASVAAETGLSGTNGLFEAAAASYRRPDGAPPQRLATPDAAAAARAARRAEDDARLAALDADDSLTLAGAGASGSVRLPRAAGGKPPPRTMRDEIDGW